MKKKKKAPKHMKLYRLMSLGKYNQKQLCKQMYGVIDAEHLEKLRAMKSYIVSKGFNFYPIDGANSVVKMATTVDEQRKVHQKFYNDMRGKVFRGIRLNGEYVLDHPELAREFLPLYKNIVALIENGIPEEELKKNKK